MSKVLTLAGVAGMGWLFEPVVTAVMTIVTVPKPAAVELAAVLVTATLPTTAELQELENSEPHDMKLASNGLTTAAGAAALLFAK